MKKQFDIETGLMKYIADLIVYGSALWLFLNFKYYANSITQDTKMAMLNLYLGYAICGYFLNIIDGNEANKSLKLLRMLPRIPKAFVGYSYRFLSKRKLKPILTKDDGVVLRSFLVKIFYVPLMLGFTISNWNAVINIVSRGNLFEIFTNFRFRYSDLLSIFFAVDTAFFAFGYLVESELLKNRVKSVEPTVFGWLVALICYPPFNSVPAGIVGWYSADNFIFPDVLLETGLKIMCVALIGLYLWATVSLGAKGSNLTNRGIINRGAYKYVRHPAYIGKISFWWITAFQQMSVGALISLSFWTLIYYLRAITEERHLIKDPDYRKYIKEVPYRFIPGVI